MKTILGSSGWQQGLVRRIRRAGVFAVLAVVIGGMQRANAAGVWVTLEAIHQIENPRNLTRPGARGELGPYQFRETTWRLHTTVPFRRALDRAESDRVAWQHYAWLERGLTRAGVAVTPYTIALAWNAGLTATVRGCAPASAHRYAQRAENLAGALAAEAAAVPIDRAGAYVRIGPP